MAIEGNSRYPHIVEAQGRAFVEGTKYSVDQIARRSEPRLSPERILKRFPGLTPAQLHAALLYHYDHQEIETPVVALKERPVPTAPPPPSERDVAVLARLNEVRKRLMTEGKLPQRPPK